MDTGFSGFMRPRPYIDFIFIHINKTAGSSIEQALGLYFAHNMVSEVIEELGPEKWHNAFTFSFVRNPWDRLVSHYLYRFNRNVSRIQEKGTDFATWVKLAYVDKNPEYYNNPKLFAQQVDWLKGPDGRIDIDFIGRFENLEEDFRHVCGELGISAVLPHLKSSGRTCSYRDFYNTETKRIAENLFTDDIDFFGYTF